MQKKIQLFHFLAVNCTLLFMANIIIFIGFYMLFESRTAVFKMFLKSYKECPLFFQCILLPQVVHFRLYTIKDRSCTFLTLFLKGSIYHHSTDTIVTLLSSATDTRRLTLHVDSFNSSTVL